MPRVYPLRDFETPSNLIAIFADIATIRTSLDFRSKPVSRFRLNREQMPSRRNRSKDDNHQFDRGRKRNLSSLFQFDYEHEHRFTEHEYDNCDWMPELMVFRLRP